MESKSLNLWKQQLGAVPASLRDNTALETLILADNALTELPDWMVEWPNLQKLDLRWVKLSSVPPAVAELEERG